MPPKPASAGRVEPTFAPQNARAGKVVAASEDAAAPSLVTDMVKGNSAGIDKTLVRQFKTAVRPPKDKASTINQLDARNRQVTRAVDNIIAGRDKISLTAPNGTALPSGRLPSNLYQFGEAIQGLKRNIYDQYERMEERAGGAGLRVPVQPAIDSMMQIANDPDLQAAKPAITDTAKRLAESWTRRGPLKPTEAGDTVQTLNKQLTDPSEAILRPAINVLRQTIDQTIMGSQGPGYQALKNQYGDLVSIEKAVVDAAARDMADHPGILEKYGNFAAIAEALTGLATHSPETLAAAGATKGAQMLVKYMQSPNRAVQQMFSHRSREISKVPLGLRIPGAMGMSQAMPGAMGMSQAGLAGQGDTGPNGGRIVARTPAQ
jgi:hypothetical protein